MIAYIEGILGDSWHASCIVIAKSGVGYQLALPQHTFTSLPEKGNYVAFHTSLVVRDDALELFGFETFDERFTFEILKSISKIGARTALGILSLYRPGDLRQAIMEDNIHALTKVPGIGQKTAMHIMLELKYKLASQKVASVKPSLKNTSDSSVFSDTLAALINLGYAEEECIAHVRKVLKDEPDLDVGSSIRLALIAISKGKS